MSMKRQRDETRRYDLKNVHTGQTECAKTLNNYDIRRQDEN